MTTTKKSRKLSKEEERLKWKHYLKATSTALSTPVSETALYRKHLKIKGITSIVSECSLKEHL